MSKEKTNETKKAAHTAKNEQETGVKQPDSAHSQRDAVHQHSIPLLLQNTMDDIIASVQNSMSDFEDIANASMTDA
jgi:hypothetical protein